jgi:hypothetical protein
MLAAAPASPAHCAHARLEHAQPLKRACSFPFPSSPQWQSPCTRSIAPKINPHTKEAALLIRSIPLHCMDGWMDVWVFAWGLIDWGGQEEEIDELQAALESTQADADLFREQRDSIAEVGGQSDVC